jgi:hypothetical protein
MRHGTFSCLISVICSQFQQHQHQAPLAGLVVVKDAERSVQKDLFSPVSYPSHPNNLATPVHPVLLDCAARHIVCCTHQHTLQHSTAELTWPGFMPKKLCCWSRASVRAWVSSLVMIASGKALPAAAAPDASCRASMDWQYSSRKHVPVADSQGRDTLMPGRGRDRSQQTTRPRSTTCISSIITR